MEEVAAGSQNQDIIEGCREMQVEIASRSGDLKAYQDELREDYHRLFVGPGHLEAPRGNRFTVLRSISFLGKKRWR